MSFLRRNKPCSGPWSSCRLRLASQASQPRYSPSPCTARRSSALNVAQGRGLSMSLVDLTDESRNDLYVPARATLMSCFRSRHTHSVRPIYRFVSVSRSIKSHFLQTCMNERRQRFQPQKHLPTHTGWAFMGKPHLDIVSLNSEGIPGAIFFGANSFIPEPGPHRAECDRCMATGHGPESMSSSRLLDTPG